MHNKVLPLTKLRLALDCAVTRAGIYLKMIPKAAAVVLLWNLCFCAAMWSTYRLVNPVIRSVTSAETELGILVVVAAFALSLSGWLADSQFGNFKVFRAGCVLMFLGSVLLCVCILIVNNVDERMSMVTGKVLGSVSLLCSFTGSACLVTVFQLGLDQMPDASSAIIVSYISLFYITLFLGCWIRDVPFKIVAHCTDVYFVQDLSLLPVLFLCVALSSLFIIGKKWLIIEPKSPQSLRNIYRVLKFAAKHKAPLNRSALTYWEEDIPSRLDLGKSRYGGPFTTEQVEDVSAVLSLCLCTRSVFIFV